MKSGYYAVFIQQEHSDFLQAINLNDKFVPSCVDWENRQTKKIGVHSYSYMSNYVFTEVSYCLHRMDESDIAKMVKNFSKVNSRVMRDYMNIVQNTIDEFLNFYYKHEDDDHTTYYYDDTSLLCYNTDSGMALKIELGTKLPTGWQAKKEILLERHSELYDFVLTLYEHVTPEIEKSIENHVYNKMEEHEFYYFPKFIENFNYSFKRKFDYVDIQDLKLWLRRNLRL